MNGFFAGDDAGEVLGKRDATVGQRVLHESNAMVKINCTVLKSFLPHTNDTEMMKLSTWNFYLSILENPEAISIVFETLCGEGLHANRFNGGVNPAWGTVKFDECLEDFWGEEEKRSRPWGWKDPRNSATIPLWKQAFKKPKMLFLERSERENRKHNSPSGEWFCGEFRGRLREYYYSPPFLSKDDETFNVNLEELLKNVDVFNSVMEWIGLKQLTDGEFKDLMERADVKYDKL
jgi:hypothetical protein